MERTGADGQVEGTTRHTETIRADVGGAVAKVVCAASARLGAAEAADGQRRHRHGREGVSARFGACGMRGRADGRCRQQRRHGSHQHLHACHPRRDVILQGAGVGDCRCLAPVTYVAARSVPIGTRKYSIPKQCTDPHT